MNLPRKLKLKPYDDSPANLGRLEAQVEGLAHVLQDMKTTLSRIQRRMESVERDSNLWRGGVSVLLGISAIAGALSAYIFNVMK